MSRNDPSAHMERSWDTVYSLSSLTAVILMTRFVCRMFHRLWATALDDDMENHTLISLAYYSNKHIFRRF